MTNCSSRVLLRVLDERGAVETTSLADALGVHPVTVSKECHELQSDGHIRQISGGVYAITDTGERHLETLSE
ncbi:DeoR family transcriptional regulator [Natronorubrum tibetense]|uniref:DeoR family transcriptional regulator n=1 Tax=Natronorubrum tibetense TaxID=63128 RepID=UPI00048062A4|nr:DeoR family transcriptional regulator [Natronorubrum tibetense]